MNTSKSGRFCHMSGVRVNKIIKQVRLLGKYSDDKAYAFTTEQVQQIFVRLQDELDRARMRYEQAYKKRFSQTGGQHARLPEYPTIVQPLPDGTCLRAVAYDDENYPAINIYWDTDAPETDGPICFAEYNPEHNPGYEVNIGAYQSDRENTIFYKPYMAERGSDG